jgi:hypothetical protein
VQARERLVGTLRAYLDRPGQVQAIDLAALEAVDRLVPDLFGPERRLVIVVEVARMRRHPGEPPALALPNGE